MERWNGSMTRTKADFFVPNGSAAIVTFDPSRRTSSSFTIRTTDTVASRGKPPCRSSKKRASGRSSLLPSTNYPRSALKSRREPFPSSVSSATTGSWISLESILPFPRPLFIPMSEPKSSPPCSKFSSTAAMNWSQPFSTVYRLGWTQTPKTMVPEKARKGYSS